MSKVLAAVAIAAIAGGIAWFALGRSDEPASPPTEKSAGSTGLTPGATGGGGTTTKAPMLDRATAAAPDKPALEVQPEPSPAQVYASELRDEAWAPQTEAEIRRRFKQVRGAKLDQADCRETRCEITVVGSETEVGKTIADLESDRGLHGFADNLLLTAPEKKSDGSLVLRAIASFRR